MKWNKIIAISFSLVCVALSFGLLLPAKEDNNFVYGALGFFVVSLSLLWFFYALLERKQSAHKSILFILVAIGISGLIIPVWWATETISNAYYAALEENFRSTTVTNFHDEMLFTERNNPIGIRLRYTVTVRRSGRYFPTPSVGDGKSRAGHFSLTAVKINPLPQLEGRGVSLAGIYKAGVSYEIIADLRPNFLLPDQKTGNPCVFFASLDEENLVKNATASQRLEVDIDGTSFSRYYGQGIHYLEHEYNLKAFYDSIAQENIPRCVGY
jgi:hypothetical protein